MIGLGIFIAIIIFVLPIILLVSLKSDISGKIESLSRKIDALSAELKQQKGSEPLFQKEEKPAYQPPPEVKPTYLETIIREQRERDEQRTKEQKEEVKPTVPLQESRPIAAMAAPAPEPIRRTPQPPQPGFFERNPDLEKFIGENLANKIGIGILVLGIGFFVKYAIDRDWIHEIGRVFIGILCGGILLGFAHKLRKTFTAFSSVLVGGGIAVLYFTIAIAFHEYHIFSQTAAFIIMIIITGFAVMLSLGYERKELAVLAILGGFASPFMVSTGEGNYVVLFSYLLILNVGMLVLAYYKKWNLVNIISYAFTILIFGGWLSSKFNDRDISMIRGALVFTTLFYFVFFFMNIINNLKERTSFKSIEISLLLSNTSLYYAAGMFILSNPYGNELKGLFTALMGIFNFAFAYGLYKNQRVDRNLVFLLIGLVLTFLSLAAPVQLEGNYITLFWSAEAVLLLWLSQKSGIKLMKLASVVVMVLMWISLMMDWQQLYGNYGSSFLRIILNKGYITGMVSLASVISTIYLLKKEKTVEISYLKLSDYRLGLTLSAILILYIANLLELRYQLQYYLEDSAARAVIIGSYNMLFILAIILFGERFLIPAARKGMAIWGMVGIAAYLFYYHSFIINTRNAYLAGQASALGFYFHYVLVLLLVVIAVKSLQGMREHVNFNKLTSNSYWWFFIFFFVFLASAELDHIVLSIAYSESNSISYIISQNHKIGFPILWGIASFLLIGAGLKKKIKDLRIISLCLLLITLLKLFVVDIRSISEGGKIAAFISLGVLLLVVSFMYQKLKKLLLDDSSEEETPATKTI